MSYSVSKPKINPFTSGAGGLKADGSPDDNDRVEIGPTHIAFEEWQRAGLQPPNLERMREHRLARVVAQLQQRDYAGVLLFDPLNIRYACDSTNMQVWTLHNYSRAVFVSASGKVILWDYHRCEHVSAHLHRIDEIRHGAGFFYFETGDQTDQYAQDFAKQIDGVLREHGGDNRRLAIDKMEVAGIQSLQKLGVDIKSGQQVMEHARVVKGPEDIKAMRCAIYSCEQAMAEMHSAMTPGMTEVELWSHLHAGNIRRGGEWIETRIFSSGPRTNPWMQECGPRIIQNGDIVSFDTDMVGPYGMCADISRSWICGDKKPTDEMRRVYQMSREHVETNMRLLAPGVPFKELTFGGHMLPDEFVAQRYGVKMHGIGLCDEFPAIYYPEDYIDNAFDYELEAGMTLCVEVYAGEVGSSVGIKIEQQVLVTETGYECLSQFPYDERLMA
ncbi:MAG: dimethylsulfonioproprionate lyase DddP [Pseudomonadota bacterium]